MSHNKDNESKQVEEMVKHIRVEAREDFKESLFQQISQDIEHSRKNERKRFTIKKFVPAASVLAGVGIATMLTILILTNGGPVTETPADDPPPAPIEDEEVEHEENEQDNEQENPEQEEQDESNDFNDDPWQDSLNEYGASERPVEISKEVTVEGQLETRNYQLLDFEELPFSTYYPLFMDWSVSQFSRETELKEVIGARMENEIQIENSVEESFIEVGFFQPGIDEETALLYFEETVAEYGGGQDVEVERGQISKVQLDRRNSISYISLAQKDDMYFYIAEIYYIEMGDGLASISDVFLDEWQWKEDGSSLR
ncbi:hypothetical protein BTS2_3922 [Bacillus sp. TS-2]|nr:hypothetical protein BTS2_3922 [Bacillus sp. TS-2]